MVGNAYFVETTTLNDAPYKYLFGMTQNIDSYKQTELTLLKNKEIQDALVRQNELVLNNTNWGWYLHHEGIYGSMGKYFVMFKKSFF